MDAEFRKMAGLESTLDQALPLPLAGFKDSQPQTGAAIGRAAEAFDATVLCNLERYVASLPPNWSGYLNSVRSAEADIQHHEKLKLEFAESIKTTICAGLIDIEMEQLGKGEISFPESVISGTGVAAAQLVLTALQSDGVNASVNEATVSFTVEGLRLESMQALIDSIRDVRQVREAELHGDSTLIRDTWSSLQLMFNRAIFGNSNDRDFLMPLTEVAISLAAESLNSTLLANLDQYVVNLPPDWDGTERSSEAGNQRHEVLKLKFAENIKSTICAGLIDIEVDSSGKGRIYFPERVISGTGVAAAQVVLAALQSNGVTASVNDSTVSFSLEGLDLRSMQALFDSIQVVRQVRENEFNRNSTLSNYSWCNPLKLFGR